MKNRIVWVAGAALALCLGLAPAGGAARQDAGASPEVSPAVAAFEGRAKAYSRLREQIEDRMPKLPKEATPEQIEAHKTTFRERVRTARTGARAGQLFTPQVAAYIRATIRQSFTRQERAELRQTVLEAETRGVPVRVNQSYPESKELVGMPPTLLLKLPQLPKQLRYRFVGSHLLLVDRENGLIVDFMRNALP